MPPTQDFGKLWPSQLYRQTHNLLIIHLIFLAERLQGTIWDIFRATHNWYHLGNAYCPERELRLGNPETSLECGLLIIGNKIPRVLL